MIGGRGLRMTPRYGRGRKEKKEREGRSKKKGRKKGKEWLVEERVIRK